MGRIMAVDYGMKRTGLAVTDPLRIIASPFETVPTDELLNFIKSYCQREQVDEFVIGLPKTLKNEDSATAPAVRKFAAQLTASFPEKKVHFIDERFTTVLAQRALIAGGMKKKDRQVKGNVDKVSAAIILQDFLRSIGG